MADVLHFPVRTTDDEAEARFTTIFDEVVTMLSEFGLVEFVGDGSDRGTVTRDGRQAAAVLLVLMDSVCCEDPDYDEDAWTAVMSLLAARAGMA